MISVRRAVAVSAAALALSAVPVGAVFAADHLDGPVVSQDPAADINDLFAWMSPDAQRVNLVMSLYPAATPAMQFSDAVTYTFHTNGQEKFLDEHGVSNDISCTFESSQEITCRLGDVVVSGDASRDTTGIVSPNGDMRVFAGVRDDPFFFNLAGFRATAETVAEAAPNLTFDGEGCPMLDPVVAKTLRDQLKTAPGGGMAEDFFVNLNALAIVVSVDKSLLNNDGKILSVWGSSTRRELAQ